MSKKYMEYENLVYYDTKIKEYIGNLPTGVTKQYVDNQDTEINNKIGDLSNLGTNDKSNIVNAINELFQNVDNGKDLIASAITDKGVDTSKDDTFETMANNILSIMQSGNMNVIHNAMESLGYDYTDLSGVNIDVTARLISKCFILKQASENVSNIMSATEGVNFNNFLIDGKLQDFGNVINPVYTKETINQTKNTVNNVFVSDDISVELINVYMGGV